jgi:hypothetical protein
MRNARPWQASMSERKRDPLSRGSGRAGSKNRRGFAGFQASISSSPANIQHAIFSPARPNKWPGAAGIQSQQPTVGTTFDLRRLIALTGIALRQSALHGACMDGERTPLGRCSPDDAVGRQSKHASIRRPLTELNPDPLIREIGRSRLARARRHGPRRSLPVAQAERWRN